MKKLPLLLVFSLFLYSCGNSSSKESAADNKEQKKEEKPSILTPEEKREGWEILFDGSNFDYWRGYNSMEMFPEWNIEEDGSMKFTPSEGGHKSIITTEKFHSFSLQLDWKISPAGNSGIFWGIIESLKYPEPYETGPEIQVLDNTGHPDAQAGTTHRAGALYDMIEPAQDVTKPVGEWNHVQITIDYEQNKGMVEMNGVQLEEFPVKGEQWEQMIAQSKFKDWPGFGKYPIGHIGLQDHGDVVWYRNIKIKRLNTQL